MAEHPRCGVAGPRMVFPTARWQPSRRRFPTVTGTIVRRTPLRLVVPPAAPTSTSTRRRPASRSRPTGCSAASCSCAARCSTSSAASTRGSASTARTSTCSTARCAPAGSGGTCPPAVVRHEHKAETDKRWLTRRTLWHWAGIARFVRKHPERLARALSGRLSTASGPVNAPRSARVGGAVVGSGGTVDEACTWHCERRGDRYRELSWYLAVRQQGPLDPARVRDVRRLLLVERERTDPDRHVRCPGARASKTPRPTAIVSVPGLVSGPKYAYVPSAYGMPFAVIHPSSATP